MTPELITQLGLSAVFAIALSAVSLKYWQHYEDEIKYLRGKVDTLEAELIKVKQALLAAQTGITSDKLQKPPF
jgi:hypothetical protein